MRRLISAVMAVALLVSVAPVLAGDSFYALSRLPAAVTPLDDAQLATVEGGDVCIRCENDADVKIYQDADNRIVVIGGAIVVGDDLSQSIKQDADVRIYQEIN